MSSYLLVVEDEPDISALVAYHLARDGYRVRTTADGREALEIIEREKPELVVLDLMLPGMSGLELLKALRSKPGLETLPVILLTARREEEDRIEGLRLGADDYVPKPFSPEELVLRVGAVLRRTKQPQQGGEDSTLLHVGSITVDTGATYVEVDGRPLDLTPTEYRLLLAMVERRGRVQSRDQLLEEVWDTSADVTTRTVDVHVQRLRKKLGDASKWIETVRGFGYRIPSERTS